MEGKVGAIAVISLENHVAHLAMGDENTSNVYAAELRAIEMALE